MKLGRIFQMTIQTAHQPVSPTIAFVRGITAPINTNAAILSSPLTLELEIQRSTLASANRALFRLYNLKEGTRRGVQKDRWDTGVYRSIVLAAGYQGDVNLPIVFQGNVMSAYSYRARENWITEIEALDGGFGQINGQISTTFPSGYSIQNLIASTVRTMPNVSLGAIGNVDSPQSPRGITLMGNSWDLLLSQIAPSSNTFVDDERVFAIGKNDYVSSPNDPFLISSQTGLLETPRRYETRIDVKTIFEPRMRVGRIVKIESEETYYNGLYSVQGVEHRGVISGAVGGDLYTMISVWKGTEALRAVQPLGGFAPADVVPVS